ncbi:SAUGI family uracil-DNA glycosylase inhibitor, partial [Nocardia sp. NPDC004604]
MPFDPNPFILYYKKQNISIGFIDENHDIDLL